MQIDFEVSCFLIKEARVDLADALEASLKLRIIFWYEAWRTLVERAQQRVPGKCVGTKL